MKIQIESNKTSLSVKEVPLDSNLSIFDNLKQNHIPIASSCGGDGVCGKCRITLLEGAENLSAANDTEVYLKERFDLKKSERIACQCQATGDIKITTTYW